MFLLKRKNGKNKTVNEFYITATSRCVAISRADMASIWGPQAMTWQDLNYKTPQIYSVLFLPSSSKASHHTCSTNAFMFLFLQLQWRQFTKRRGQKQKRQPDPQFWFSSSAYPPLYFSACTPLSFQQTGSRSPKWP